MRKSFFYLLLSSLFVFFIGCSQVVPEIKQANATVIFDYKDMESYPDSRLCVFVQSESNINRYEMMILSSHDPDFTWETSELAKRTVSKKNYVGYTNFSLPQGITLPLGNYSVVYKNADEEQAELSFFLNYDLSLYETKASEIEDKLKENKIRKKVQIFDSSSVLIYYGDYNFSSKEDIKKKVHDADTFRLVLLTLNNNLICIMPSEKI